MRGLYLVTPDWDDTERLLEVTALALAGGAAVVQYRNKTATPALRHAQAERLLELCRRNQRPLLINDHVGLCRTLDADGVHIGEMDDLVGHARAALGNDKIVGVSCYGSLELAVAASKAGASYVAFGGFYASRVKKYAVTTAPSIVTEAKAAMQLPVAVIGGMTAENAAPLVARGADMVAVISSIYGAPDPRAAARAFANLFRSDLPSFG